MTSPKRNDVVAASSVEPSGALVAGGLLGATTFLLAALLFGARAALAIAAVALIVSLVRRTAVASMAFALSAALCGVAVLSSVASLTLALAGAAGAFGTGLTIFTRARVRDRHSRTDAAMPRTAPENV